MIRILFLLGMAAGVLAAVELVPTITVEEKAVMTPAGQGEEPLEEKQTLTQEGIALFGPAAQSSAFSALDIEPGIVVESRDPYGLGQVDARDRGVGSYFMGLSVEGVPNYSIRPIGPRQGLYDLENMQQIDHYRGALNPGTGPGVGSKAGMVDLQWERPQQKTAARLATRIGGDGFYKLYGRLDTGEMAGAFRSFLSLSNSSADKWKGAGDLGPRTNIAAGVVGTGDAFPLEIFYNHTQHRRHDFMGLSYSQVQNLSANYDLDYQDQDANASDYYDYHKRDQRYDELHLGLKRPCFGALCRFKLYGADYLEKSDEGDGKGTVDARRIGLRVTALWKRESWESEAGVWGEQSWLDKYVEKVRSDPTRAHLGWKWLNKNDGPDRLLSPYLRVGAHFEALRLEGGVRYLYYRAAANDTYLGNNPESDYDRAVQTGTVAPGGAVDAKIYREWLPTLGARYLINDNGELFAKWGRGYQRPYRYSFAAKYAANAGGIRDTLLAQGEDLQTIVERWKMETSELYDLGVRGYSDAAEATLSVFYHRHLDLLSTAHDPSLGIDYLQNVGDATVYGVELQSSIEPAEGLWLFFNPAWMQSRINENLGMGGTLYDLEGNDIPETPRWVVKAGGAYHFGDGQTFSVSARHIGGRYADVENREKVPSYTTADLRYACRFAPEGIAGTYSLFAALLNVTDEEYVAGISSADLLEDTPSYYVGAPRSFIFGLEGRF